MGDVIFHDFSMFFCGDELVHFKPGTPCYAVISKYGETCCFQVGPTKKDTDIMRSTLPSKNHQKVRGDHGTNIPLTSNQPPSGGNSLLRTARGSDLFKAFLLLSAMGFITIEEKHVSPYFPIILRKNLMVLL